MPIEYTPPSSPSDRKKIQDAISEYAKSLQRGDDEKSLQKDIGARMKEELEVPPKLLRKLAVTLHKHNFGDAKAEYEDFEAAYEVFIEGRND